MNWHAWGMFVVAVFLLSGTPGPNMLHILSRSVELGMKRTVAAMAGCLAAVVTALTASAAGLAALLMAVPGAFDVLRYAGVGYLVWLGIKAWRAEATPIDVGDGAMPSYVSPARLFRGGFAIGISNPKLLLFAAAFLPQFVDPHHAQPPQFAILVATFAVIESFWYAVYALGGRSIAQALRAPGLKRWFNRATGAIFVGFGLALLGTRAG